MITLLINLLVLCIVLGLVWWVLSLIPLPAPVKQIALVIFVVIAVIYLINLLPGFTGHRPW